MPLLTSHPLPRRRGSVLILVVAVLVLLALMGTAYIATSRSDRIASASSETTASVDTLARGVVDTLKTQVATERLDASNTAVGTVLRNTATAYFSYNSPTSTIRTDGLLSLAARVPVAPAVGDRPRWPFISSPLSASPSDPGFFTNPAPNAPVTGSSWTPTATRTLNSDRWGQNETERRGSATNVIGSVTLTADGRTYPAFLTSTGTGPTVGYTIAADADGDGIADAGLVSLGSLPNSDFAGITFFYGLRVIDNNSAFNANTAWTTGPDALVGSAVSIARNNRLFPSAIGLKESLTPTAIGGTSYIDDFEVGVTAFRAGRLGTGNPLNDRAIPIIDVDPTNGRTDFLTRRTDFQFNTQHELLYFQLGRRLDFPGGHGNPTGGTGYARFTPFTLAEQAQLAYGFVLAPRDIADNTNFPAAIDKRTPVEQLLSGSLYRVSGFPLNPLSLTIPTAPYATSNIGTRRTTPDQTNWFNENFNYDSGTGTDPVSILNLRPLLVTHNPVAQSTTFKPLPLEAVLPADPAAGPRYDVMHPYVPRWRDPTVAPALAAAQQLRYNPGDVVFAANGASDGQYYINAHSAAIDGDIDPTNPANRAPASGPTDRRPWQIYTGSLVPTKVDLNRAPFGDLWRAFYLAFASDNIDPAVPNGRLNTVSPFGAAPAQNLVQIYQGMDFTAVGPGGADTFPAAALSHPQRMFRSNIKDYGTGDTYLQPDQMVLLRAAQAAVNAEYLRSLGAINPASATLARDDVPSRTIALTATVAGVSTPVAATVFAAPRGLYISEVYINTDIQPTGPGGSTNAGGYIAIEVFNPYPFSISLAGWKLQVVDRTSANGATGRTVRDLFTFDPASTLIVPPGGHLVLENINPSGETNGTNGTGYTATDAEYRPEGSGVAPSEYNTPIPGFHYVPALEKAFAATITGVRTRGELVLTRPATGFIVNGTGLLLCTGSGSPTALSTTDAVPVDSIDLTSVDLGGTTAGDFAFAYHYARRVDNWNFVYPGRYNADPALADVMRQQGLRRYTWRTGIDPSDSAVWASPGPVLGAGGTGAGAATYTGDGGTTPGQFPIQIANIGYGGPNVAISNLPVAATPPNRFPFGGFLRILDVLQVPFISPVRIHAPGVPATQYDVISLTQDAAFAEDTATDDNAEENIGRMTPIILPAVANSPPRARAIATIDESSTDPLDIRYGWASDILDYVTVQPAAGLNTPSATARRKPAAPPISASEPYTVASYPETSSALIPQAVASKPGSFSIPSSITAPDAGNQGLININTAPLPVLAAVPWVRNTGNDRLANVTIARSIIAHREKNGPFRSLFDLNAVRMIDPANPVPTETVLSFRTGSGVLTFAASDNPTTPGNTEVFTTAFIPNLTADNGDFSPIGDSAAAPFSTRAVPDPAFPGQLGNTNTDGTPVPPVADPLFNLRPEGDFESQFLMLNAVSNLLTTRSDTFTAYIVIEGWRNAGTASATRVLQRRYAYILDRSAVAPGVPPQVLNLDPTALTNGLLQPVVTPNTAGVPLSRPLNTSIRSTEIPVPQNP